MFELKINLDVFTRLQLKKQNDGSHRHTSQEMIFQNELAETARAAMNVTWMCGQSEKMCNF